MNFKKVKLVYFSATGTTRKVLEGIAKGIAIDDVEHINLTLPENKQKTIGTFSDELVILGAPVYGGRMPAEAVTRFKQLKAAKTPAVLIVLYGNREFDDALLELKNISTESGFIPIAGGAFIGEHSFSTKGIPIANGRPDRMDIQTAKGFGEKIKDKFVKLESLDDLPDLKVPGCFPYQAGGSQPIAVSPATHEEACTLCGICSDVCPTAAISIDKNVSTRTDLCIRCSACIKECPENARSWDDSKMKTIINWLKENCSTRKEPLLYGVKGGAPDPGASLEPISACKSKCC